MIDDNLTLSQLFQTDENSALDAHMRYLRSFIPPSTKHFNINIVKKNSSHIGSVSSVLGLVINLLTQEDDDFKCSND